MTNHDELCEKDKEIKELRTRMAEEERMKDAAVVQADTFKTAWEELKKRVAELTENLLQKEIEINKLNDEVNAWVEANRRTRDGDLISQKLLYDCKFELQRKANIEVLHESEIKELRTRVAEANKIIEAKHDYCSSLCCDIANLQDRLSQAEEKEKELRENWLEDMQEWSVEKATLLKASEGMEKALDSLVEHTIACEEQLDKFHGLGNDSGSGSSVCVLNAQSALADFRAVKENMEKGAGK